jgi:hypothetical protein
MGMKSSRATPHRPPFSPPPVIFMAGEHALSIAFVAEGRWTVSVDGGPASRTFQTQVEAWEAGVQAAHAHDQARRP